MTGPGNGRKDDFRMQTSRIALLIAAMAGGLALNAAEAREGPRAGFAEIDADGDGLVTAAELEALAAARFAAADADGDGGLSAEELLGAGGDRRAERVARMLDRLDSDGDGLLQRSELEAGRGGPRGGGGLERFIARADTDGDGALSEAEFDAARERMADRRGGPGPHGPRGPHGGGHGGDGPGRDG